MIGAFRLGVIAAAVRVVSGGGGGGAGYLAVAHTTSPFVTLYKRDGDTFTKLADPATLPTGEGRGAAFSTDGVYLAIAHANSPSVTIYKRSGDTFTKLANPATLPGGSAYSSAFSPDGVYLGVGSFGSPSLTIYKRDGDTFNKLADPATLPTGRGQGAAFSPDGVYLAIAHNNSPVVTIYKRSGDTFTKLANPATLPTGEGQGASFSPDGVYLAIAHSTSPFVTIYKRSGDDFTKLANPATLPTGWGYGAAFSPDGAYLAVAHDVTPYVTIYKRDGDTFTKLPNPAALPTNFAYGVGFDTNGDLSVAHFGSPFATIYKRSGDTFTKLANPATLPAGTGRGVAWYPSASASAGGTSQNLTFVTQGSAPDMVISADGLTATTGPNASSLWHKARSATARTPSAAGWYFEVTVGSNSGGAMAIGVALAGTPATSSQGGSSNAGDGGRLQYFGSGQKRSNGIYEAYGPTFTTGDVIGCSIRINGASAEIRFYKNGVDLGVAFTVDTSSSWEPHLCHYANTTSEVHSVTFTPLQYLPAGFTAWGASAVATLDAKNYVTGQTWANSVASPADGSAQTAFDWVRGPDTATSSLDPTIAGAGSDSAYFAFDGAQYFTHSLAAASMPEFLRRMHHAGRAWTIEVWMQWAGAPGSNVHPLFDSGTSDQGGPDMSRGVMFGDLGSLVQTAGRLGLRIKGDSGGASALSVQSDDAIPSGSVQMLAASYQAGGASFLYRSGAFAKVGGQDTFTATLSSPGTNDATNPSRIGARGDASFRVPSGTRVYLVRLYSRALSKSELDQAWGATKGRFGL